MLYEVHFSRHIGPSEYYRAVLNSNNDDFDLYFRYGIIGFQTEGCGPKVWVTVTFLLGRENVSRETNGVINKSRKKNSLVCSKTIH